MATDQYGNFLSPMDAAMGRDNGYAGSPAHKRDMGKQQPVKLPTVADTAFEALLACSVEERAEVVNRFNEHMNNRSSTLCPECCGKGTYANGENCAHCGGV